MNFLYPLFLAGIAAIGVPIVLHMIRRHTRKRVTFSSLMFLHTTMPRFKNRSRLENLPLLILRCIVVCLLAFAFSRPFFSLPIAQSQVRLGRRIVLLIDTSASMRRDGMWARAVREAQSVLDRADRTDRVCVMSFDRGTRTLMGFEQWGQTEPARRASVTADQISGLSPSWALTDLGHALVTAAEAIEDDEVNDGGQSVATRQVIVVSDLQQGSNLEALRGYEWPKDTELVIKLIRCKGTTNAALQLVTDRSKLGGPAGDVSPRIRIANSSDATAERFQLSWAGATSESTSTEAMDVYVPGGRSIVVRAPARANRSQQARLILTGDDHDFDNSLYLAPHLPQQIKILYIGGDDPNDSGDMLYYVRKAFGAAGAFDSRVIWRPGNEPLAATDIETAHLILVAEAASEENLTRLRRYLDSGRTIALVMKSAGAVTAIAGLTGMDNLESAEADVDRYAMLGRLEFEHPLLVPFSEPRFGDFTRVHIWKYRSIDIADCPGARVLAWYDSNDPAWFEIPVGKGSLLVLTCGWHPSDSDLALSSKFVPLLYSILEYGGPGGAGDGGGPNFAALAGGRPQYFVGEPVPMPSRLSSGPAKLQIRKPDGSLVTLEAGRQIFTQTDTPGIYAVESAAGNRLFAVNMPARECRTAPMPIEDLEKLGVSLEQSPGVEAGVRSTTKKAEYRASFAEMEYRQKLWRWVLVAALAVLLIEIWLGGWLARPIRPSEGEPT
ncbi:MAG: BatA and WFA domain-containing protein [Phycisphaerales bacterium]|nr:MAG: BatA and WFA domain-containing protein [Phycisphaerales bacterium]